MNMKKVLSVFLVLALMLGTVPGMSFAVQAEDEPAAEPAAETIAITNQQTSGTMTVTLTVPERDPVPYLDTDGTQKQTGSDCYDVYTTDTSLGIASTEQWYVVRESMTLETTANLKILGDVRLIICDGATLTVPNGINLDNGSITVYGQSNDPQTMGKLIANSDNDGQAAIGSSASKTSGAITINSCIITATGSENGAAISGSLTVNAGVVTAAGKPALSGSHTFADDIFAKAGDSEDTAVDTASDQLNGKNYVYIAHKHTVTWLMDDGTLIDTTKVWDGEIPTHAIPEKPAAQYTYTFTGWTPEIAAATGDATYTAVFKNTFNTYTVTWLNNDGAVLEIDEYVPYGDTPVYNGDIPEYSPAVSNDSYTIVHHGWDKEIVPVTGDVTYTAAYTTSTSLVGQCFPTPELYQSATYSLPPIKTYFSIPTQYAFDKGRVSVTLGPDSMVFTHNAEDGWQYLYIDDNQIIEDYLNNGLSSIVSSTSGLFIKSGSGTLIDPYVAEWYSKKVTITFNNADGTTIDTMEVPPGAVVTHADAAKDADSQYVYSFTGWTNSNGTFYAKDTALPVASGDETYTATYNQQTKLTISKGKYIRLGYYNGVPVDWYCQRINGTGTMMLCKYALKASTFGSNATYKTSNVHAWLDLNSGGTIATDLGLTKAELSLVRSVNLSKTAGDGTDTFIIPAYENDELNKGQKVTAPYSINNPSSLVSIYWLRTARDSSNARVINHGKDGSPTATVAARYSGVGNSQWIRPMFYLDTNAIKNLAYSGSGTAADPYVFESRYSISANATPNGGGTVSAAATRDGKKIYSGKLPGDLVSGSEVTLTVTPAAGYGLKSLIVTDEDNNNISLTDNKFTMPKKAVTVTASFKKLKYSVIWKDTDGTVLEADENLEYGDATTYDSAEPTKEGCTFTGWTDGKNTYATDTLPTATANVTYTAVYSFNNGVGARLVGHTLSLNGDIGVNFCMDLDPAIASSESAYMHFTIPNGNKTSAVDVPVSQATVVGNYYVFKCNVAAKDMNATITARIIDGETSGEEYTYSVRDYADYLLNHTSENAAYAKAAPLVKSMLNYGAYAQLFFVPDVDPAKLANVGYETDISGVTAQTINKSTYTNELNGVADFSGATLSLKTQTSLSLYFTSDEELTFNCDHNFEVEKKNGYQIIRIRNISANDLVSDFTVTVTAGENSGTISFSPMNYCYNVLNDNEQPEALQNVCKALYLYSQGAKDYFHVHTPGEAVSENEVPATCTAPGSHDEVVYCTECGSEISREAKIDILPHTLIAHEKVPATYEADGVKAYYECSECHKIFTDAEGKNETTEEALVIPMLEKIYVLDRITENITVQDGFIITGTLKRDFRISIADGATVTLSDATINCSSIAGITPLGDATILLEGTSTVRGGSDNPGIYVPQNKTLTIEGDGSLNVSSSGDFACGIGGGGISAPSGNIVINSGTITAASANWGTGIGSSYHGNGGNITINGGTVTATGGSYCAGIGSSGTATCGDIIINGGTVTAKGGSHAAGIGSGREGSCGNITIAKTVTKVTATSGAYAIWSIGAGKDGTCGTVTIESGANVTQN